VVKVADFVFSLEIELGLGTERSRSQNRDKVLDQKIERAAVPKIIALCKKHEIKPTFAVCGHLFLNSCDGRHAGAKTACTGYAGFFEKDPKSNFPKNKSWYAPDIVGMIKKSGFEIASHSFSHPSFLEITKDAASFEVKECVKLAKKEGVGLKTFVFPFDESAFLDVIKSSKFSHVVLRPKPRHLLLDLRSFGFSLLKPRLLDNGLIEVPKTFFLNRTKKSDLIKLWLLLWQAKLGGGTIHIWAHSHNLRDDSYFEFIEKIFLMAKKIGLKSKFISAIGV